MEQDIQILKENTPGLEFYIQLIMCRVDRNIF